VGASIGIARLDDQLDHLPDLMAHADAALYRAKAMGKGRVVS
jgi:PleD family two-component response regulator